MTESLPIDPRNQFERHRGRRDRERVGPPRWPAVLVYFFVAGWLVATALLVPRLSPAEPWRWMDTVFPLLAALGALGALGQRLPGQNVVCIGGIVLVFTATIIGCGAVSGIPFGVIRFTERAEPLLFDRFPLWSPLWWVAILVASRETGRLMMQPYRKSRSYGLGIMGLAALLAVVTDLSWEPFGVRVKTQWIWLTSERMLCWQGAPWVNFLGWVAVAVVTLGFCMPWFISKHPVAAPLKVTPAVVWVLINAHFIAGNALHGLWLPAGLGLLLVATVFSLAWRGIEHQGEYHPGHRGARHPGGEPLNEA